MASERMAGTNIRLASVYVLEIHIYIYIYIGWKCMCLGAGKYVCQKINLFDQAVDRFTGGRPVQLNMVQTVDRFAWKPKRSTGSVRKAICHLSG